MAFKNKQIAAEYRNKNRDKLINYRKEWHEQNPSYSRDYKREWALKNPEKYLLMNPRNRAKKRGLDFTLTEADVKIPSHCPVLGVKLEPVGSNSVENQYGPSIHRLDSSKGYTKDNCIVVSWRANTLLQDASFEEIQSMFKFAERYMSNEEDED